MGSRAFNKEAHKIKDLDYENTKMVLILSNLSSKVLVSLK